jgi:uncharacterized membrane protein
MSRDAGDVIGEALGRAARETVQTISTNARKAQRASNGHLSGPRGLAAGAGLVALAPLAVRGAGKLAKSAGGAGGGPVMKKARDAVSGSVKDAVGKKVDEAGGVGGVVKEAGKGMLPGAGGGKSNGTEAVPKGRRMPIQQSIDVAVSLQEAYNAWTQFEDWPQFMHRLDRVTQEDDTHVSFKTKIWGISKEFEAEIVEQRPDDRIKWRVVEGVSHTGVVSFHELADRLTRIDVDVSLHPGSLIEKAARGMRHVKRAVRADLARFKAHVELDEDETGEWRGVIEDGDVKSTRSSAAASRSSARSSGRSSSSGSKGRSSSSRGSTNGRKSSSRSSSGSTNGRSSSSSRSSGSSGRSSSSRAASSGSGRSSSGGSGSSRGTSSRGSSSKASSSKGSSRSSSNRAKASSNGRSGSGSSRQKASSRS